MYIVEEQCMVKTQENQERADSKKWLVIKLMPLKFEN